MTTASDINQLTNNDLTSLLSRVAAALPSALPGASSRPLSAPPSADRLTIQVPAASAPAEYRLDLQDGHLCVSLVTPDRYLSQSIEQDLVHSGDKLADLLHDELIDVEFVGPPLTVDHFRSPPPDKLFTFRTKLPSPREAWPQPQTVADICKVIAAYQACFGPLGSMTADGDE